MRSRVWLVETVVATPTERLLANPPVPRMLGAGKYCCSFCAAAESRFVGIWFPANGALLLSGSLIVIVTPEKSPVKNCDGIWLVRLVVCFTCRKPSYDAMKNVLSLPL